MPLLYGEGERPFTRLQEEIMKVSDDHSLFAWQLWRPSRGLLATSPEAFSKSSEITKANPSETSSGAITVNNKGIHLKLRVIDRALTSERSLFILPCVKEGKEVAIYVKALSNGNEYYERTETDTIELLGQAYLSKVKYRERSICVRREHLIPQNKSLLPEAIADGNSMVVKLLLEKGAQLESRYSLYQTPLLIAVKEGYVEIVQLLLEKGAQLESKDVFNQTPLLIAVNKRHIEMVKLLLEKGARLESRDDLYQPPLSIAVKEGYVEIVQLLLEKGAQLESKDVFNRTPLLIAVKEGYVEIAQLLLEKGANLESEDEHGWTPLRWATSKGHEAFVKLLLERGAVRIE